MPGSFVSDREIGKGNSMNTDDTQKEGGENPADEKDVEGRSSEPPKVRSLQSSGTQTSVPRDDGTNTSVPRDEG